MLHSLQTWLIQNFRRGCSNTWLIERASGTINPDRKRAPHSTRYIIVSQTTYVQDSSFSITIVVHLSANCITTWCHDYHDCHVTITWLSHDHYMNCYMTITWLTWLSNDSNDYHMNCHVCHMIVTWLSHDCHMIVNLGTPTTWTVTWTVTMIITLLSHDCHMTVKIGTHLAQAQGWSTVHFQPRTVCQCCTYYCPWGTQRREA